MQKGFQSILFVVAAAVFLVSTMAIRQTTEKRDLDAEALKIERKINQVNGLLKVANERENNIQRVLTVLNRFNNAMPTDLKYSIAEEIIDASLKYENLDIDLICATITHESAFSWEPSIISPAGALGLMQVMPETGEFLARIEGVEWTSPKEVLFNPVINIRLGSRYLSSLIELYGVDGGLAAYNGGQRIAERWIAHNRADGILYRETQHYVPAVLSLYDEFRN